MKRKNQPKKIYIWLSVGLIVVLIIASSIFGFKRYNAARMRPTSNEAPHQDTNLTTKPNPPQNIASSPTIPPTNLSNIKTVVPPPRQDKVQAIPILEYHHIRDFTDRSAAADYYTSVSPALFQEQMITLKNAGYKTVSFDQYLAGKASGKSVIITFDDGDEDAYTTAYPVLQSLGFQGVFYIITSFIDQPNYLTLAQIKEMSDNGMVIGSHTVNHADLTKIDQSLVFDQLSSSKTRLEEIIGKPVKYFCYPFGGYDKLIVAMAQEAGYLTATTTRQAAPGAFQSYLTLPRIIVVPGLQPATLLKRIVNI